MKSIYPLCFIVSLGLADCKAAPHTQTGGGYQVHVTSVVDGDTFVIDAPWSPFPNIIWKVRIRGIDSPELHSHCMAEKVVAYRAKIVATGLIHRTGGTVTLFDVKADKYGGRFDATVILGNGKSLGDALVQSGLARIYNGGQRAAWCDDTGAFIR